MKTRPRPDLPQARTYTPKSRTRLACCFLCLFTSTRAFASLTLADNGQTKYTIVLPANPIPSERYAAEELQRYLERISGAKLPILTDTGPLASREILLGDNAHLRTLKQKIDFNKLGPDGFVLRTEGGKLVIAGGRPRGTLYGVYALLDD